MHTESILYFEDDEALANMVSTFLIKQSYQVDQFCSFEEFLKQAISLEKQQYKAVILDIDMPNTNGYQICQKLLQSGLSEETPILFTSGHFEPESILSAYAVGGHEYLVKPIKLTELLVKLQHQTYKLQKDNSVNLQLKEANNIASRFLEINSELSAILKFTDECNISSDILSLTRSLLKLVHSFGVEASVKTFDHNNLYLTTNKTGNELEEQAIEVLRQKDKIYSWAKRTVFNYSNFSLLVLNMPVENESRVAELKDLICIALNTFDVKLSSLNVINQETPHKDFTQLLAEKLNNVIPLIKQNNVSLSTQLVTVFNELEHKLIHNLAQLKLPQIETELLIDHINIAVRDAQAIFDFHHTKEAEITEQMNVVLTSINKH